MHTQPLLLELGTEELPAKGLKNLSDAFSALVARGLTEAKLSFSHVEKIATPRRLGLIIHDLVERQADEQIEKRGPPLAAAFDDKGHITKATEGFLRANQAEASALFTRDKYVWLSIAQMGRSIDDLLQPLLERVISELPMGKRMRWGAQEEAFIRPVHSLVVLYGDRILPVKLLGCQADRRTFGHRFHHPEAVILGHANTYLSQLENAFVIPQFEQRRHSIMKQATALAQLQQGVARLPEALLDEVTGLVEWPVAICGHFDPAFLTVPAEALISAMEGHQKSFAVFQHEHALLPCFITVSNIQSHDLDRVIRGNERVMRARLSDAAFFYQMDLKQPLSHFLAHLPTVIFQAKLGTLAEKNQRIQQLAVWIAEKIKIDVAPTERAAVLCKADVMTQLVGEFPELQGIAGYHYALAEGESVAVAKGIKSHYHPRFSGDSLPENEIGEALGLADRMDTLVGIFSIGQRPTGEKDPFALRRAALGFLRIVIEKQRSLDLNAFIDQSLSVYHKLPGLSVKQEIYGFMMDRLRSWYAEQGISKDVFEAVAAKSLADIYDIHQRIQALQRFIALPEAKILVAAQKRVSNLLQKEGVIDRFYPLHPDLFVDAAEKTLAAEMGRLSKVVEPLYADHQYGDMLAILSDVHKPIQVFFDTVMIIVPEQALKENRLALLQHLRALFLQVADISLLQLE